MPAGFLHGIFPDELDEVAVALFVYCRVVARLAQIGRQLPAHVDAYDGVVGHDDVQERFELRQGHRALVPVGRGEVRRQHVLVDREVERLVNVPFREKLQS